MTVNINQKIQRLQNAADAEKLRGPSMAQKIPANRHGGSGGVDIKFFKVTTSLSYENGLYYCIPQKISWPTLAADNTDIFTDDISDVDLWSAEVNYEIGKVVKKDFSGIMRLFIAIAKNINSAPTGFESDTKWQPYYPIYNLHQAKISDSTSIVDQGKRLAQYDIMAAWKVTISGATKWIGIPITDHEPMIRVGKVDSYSGNYLVVKEVGWDITGGNVWTEVIPSTTRTVIPYPGSSITRYPVDSYLHFTQARGYDYTGYNTVDRKWVALQPTSVVPSMFVP